MLQALSERMVKTLVGARWPEKTETAPTPTGGPTEETENERGAA